MQDKVNYAQVGLFVVILGAALIAAVLWLAAGATGKTKYYTYQSIIKESVSGLNIDAPVKLLGVNVGKVSQIAIDPSNSSQVRLRFLIEQGTPIKQDTEAVLKSQGLTGIAYVELTGGSAQSPALIPIDEQSIPNIQSKPSLATRLETVLSTVLSNIDTLSGNVNAMFDDDNKVALKQILSDGAIVSQALAAQKNTFTLTMANAAVTSSNAAKASAQMAPTMDRVAVAVSSFEALAKNATLASQKANKAIDTAALTIDQVSVDTLPTLTDLMAEINQLVGSLQRLSDQTVRNPNSLLLGAPQLPAGPGEKAFQ